MKPEVAEQQFQADEAAQRVKTQENTPSQSEATKTIHVAEDQTTDRFNPTTPASQPVEEAEKKAKRFYGSVKLDPIRLQRDAGAIAPEIVQHLTSLDVEVQVTIEITVNAPEGIPDAVKRSLNQKCQSLKFKTHEFEEE